MSYWFAEIKRELPAEETKLGVCRDLWLWGGDDLATEKLGILACIQD